MKRSEYIKIINDCYDNISNLKVHENTEKEIRNFIKARGIIGNDISKIITTKTNKSDVQ